MARYKLERTGDGSYKIREWLRMRRVSTTPGVLAKAAQIVENTGKGVGKVLQAAVSTVAGTIIGTVKGAVTGVKNIGMGKEGYKS